MRRRSVSGMVVAGAVAVGLVVGGAAPAHAVTQNVGGGTWSYGVTATTNYSNYYHGSYYHRSTAYNSSGTQRAYGEAGYWSRAGVKATLSGNQAAWYHNYGYRNI